MALTGWQRRHCWNIPGRGISVNWKNVIGRAVLICQEQWISVSDLNLEISLPKEEETQWTEEEKEKALLLQTLEKTGDNRSKAARLLNVSRTTLYEKLRKYHIID